MKSNFAEGRPFKVVEEIEANAVRLNAPQFDAQGSNRTDTNRVRRLIIRIVEVETGEISSEG